MTVVTEPERHLHHPRIYITDATNIVSLYTLSSLLQSKENLNIYYNTEDGIEGSNDDDLIKKICPNAVKETGPVAQGMERSVLFLRPSMSLEQIKAPLEGHHRFVLIISMIGADDPDSYPFLKPITNLESEARNAGYESYCILRLPPLYQHLNLIEETTEIESEFVAIDAEDAATAISHILLDPEIHRGEIYSIHSPTPISPHTLKSSSPSQNIFKFHGDCLQTSEMVTEFIKSDQSKVPDNQFVKITGFEDMIGFEEFIKKYHESLYHQRFICRQ